jgi:23S rRNA (uracil-5-)-methyltransferase RumA
MNPLCSHRPGCGGCTQQPLPYGDQLLQKQAEIEKIFSPFPVLSILPCAHPWHYRNKMEFSFSQNKAGDRFLGLILRRSRGKVFNLQECLIAPPWFSEALGRVRTWWEESGLLAFHFRKGEGSLRTLTLREGRRTGDRLAMLTVSGDPRFALKRAHLESFVAALNDPKMSVFLRIQQATAGRPTQFFEMHLSGPVHIHEKLFIQGKTLTFKISPTSFFQPNTEQAEQLYNLAFKIAGISSCKTIYDLYCGTATLGMIFAPLAEKIYAIELNPHAVFDARMNAELNQITNIEIECGDVGKVLAEKQASADLVLVDPPRAGLDARAIAALLKLAPQKIVYISCNPATQAENIRQLSGYRLIKLQPVDQFPHTPHIENIALLERPFS